MKRSRFSLLLLEESETYITDIGIHLYLPSNSNKKFTDSVDKNKPFYIGDRKVIKSSLKICTKSLIIEPNDSSLPIYRFPYINMYELRPCNTTLNMNMSEGLQTFFITSSKYSQMLAYNKNSPYAFIKSNIKPIESKIKPFAQFSIYSPHTWNHYVDPLQFYSPDTFIIQLSYVSLSSVYPLISNLREISKYPSSDQHTATITLLKQRESEIVFDSSWIVNLNEIFLLGSPLTVSRISPLVEERGYLQITSARVYFQPFSPVIADPLIKFNLSNMHRVFKRKYQMRHCGLEIFISEQEASNMKDLGFQFMNKPQTSIFFSFDDQNVRDYVFDLIWAQEESTGLHEDISLKEIIGSYTEGKISNFDYIMFLNQLSGRSFNDICQYPIFPWVIADYDSSILDLLNPSTYRDLTKPIGALNPERLEIFRKRYRDMPTEAEMGHPPFLYGTHYSTPGYVLYYLVRKAPEYMLRLQNGQFDKADRLFYSIAQTWQGIYTNQTDLKELIPEFYDSDGSFLINSSELNLGTKSDGKLVGDVILPKWAKSPEEFIRKNREALESEIVSTYLHNWIDLIFGHLQKGAKALRADNLFYYLTYEGSVDVDKIQDPVQLSSILSQINEFGQTPSQIFVEPHPARINLNSVYISEMPLFSRKSNSFIKEPKKRTSFLDSNNDFNRSSIDDLQTISSSKPSPIIVKNVATILSLDNTFDSISSNSKKESMKDLDWFKAVPDLKFVSAVNIHRSSISSMVFDASERNLISVNQDGVIKVFDTAENRLIRSSNVCQLALTSCKLISDQIAILGSLDNNVYLYSFEAGRTISSFAAHDDAVSCIAAIKNGNIFASGSWCSDIKVWQISESEVKKHDSINFCEHDSALKTLSINSDSNLLLSGSSDGIVMLWDIRSSKHVKSFNIHMDEVSGVEFVANNKTFLSSSLDGTLCSIDICSGKLIDSVNCDDKILCFHSDGQSIVCGTENGAVQHWTYQNRFCQNSDIDANQCPISSVALSLSGNKLAVGLDHSSENLRIFNNDILNN